nr:hypothetical protein Iba_chr04dCG8410 [Ipomoea batatas]
MLWIKPGTGELWDVVHIPEKGSSRDLIGSQTRVSQSPSVPLALSLRRLIRRPVALILCLSGLDHLASSSEVRVSHRARLPSSQSSTRRSLGLGLYM